MSNTVNLALFKNTSKDPNDKDQEKHPDWRYGHNTQEKNEEGKDIWFNILAGWDKVSANGMEYISISLDLDGLKKYIKINNEEQESEGKTKTKPVMVKEDKPETKAKQADSIINPDDLPF